MKTQLLSLLFFLPAFAEAMAVPQACFNLPALTSAKADPIDFKVVVSQKRIWLLADEMPMKCLKTQIKDASGKVVLEKCFTSKCSDWFLDIEALPKGEYTLYLGSDQIEKFKK
jgi:hypothetical protein